MRLNKMDVLGLLQEHGAVASGHFRLPSGLHTPVYLQTALVLQYPHVAQKVAKALAAKFAPPVEVVISTGMSSVVLGQEVARAKKCRAIFTERANGAMAFRRDFKLERGERALIVVDVLTTGRSNAEVVALAQAYGVRVVGVGAMVDRSSATLCLGVPTRGERALIVVDVLTTGRSNAEVVALAQAYGARVVGVGAMVDRSSATLCLGVPTRGLVCYPLQAAPPDSCPQCAAGVPLSTRRRECESGPDGE